MKNPRFYLLLLVILVGLVFGQPAFAQVADEQVNARKAQLEAELKVIEQEIAAQQALLAAKKKETGTIQGDLNILTAQIAKAQLTIKSKKLEIEKIGGEIVKHQKQIETLEQRIGKGQKSLSELLRKRREMDDTTIAEVVLDEGSLTSIFTDDNAFFFLENGMHRAFNQLRGDKVETESEKVRLQKKRDAELDAQKKIETEKKTVEAKEGEKKTLLSINKNQEASYQAVLKQKEAKRQSILTALFQLRGSAAIPFSKALEYANSVSKGTGVRPAFILAILTQETRLGANVGTCNRPGDPPEKHWTQIMKPTRDLEPFKRIVASLGISPEGLPLSCPMAGGWGGAMGPAQFIPSTWEMYAAKVARVTGNNPANPWNNEDAFAASATYLGELGATGQTYTAERTAALKYYAGGNWAAPANAFYGNSVMNLAAGYQSQIDFLQNN